jgi:iron(III) transport system permease protein
MAATAEASGFRGSVIGGLFLLVAAPAVLVIYQSFLDAPFFDAGVNWSLEAYRFARSGPRLFMPLAWC